MFKVGADNPALVGADYPAQNGQNAHFDLYEPRGIFGVPLGAYKVEIGHTNLQPHPFPSSHENNTQLE